MASAAEKVANNIAIAQKAINLAMHLSGADKAVASAILDHFNKKTGQCDPSNERIALLLGVDVRTVRRATEQLCGDHGMFRKSSHGGKSCRASYTPQWSVFRSIVQDWDRRMRSGAGPNQAAENRAKMSGSKAENRRAEQGENVRETGRKCPPEQGENALQTHLNNPSYEPISTSASSEGDAARAPTTLNSGVMAHGLLSRENSAARPPGYEARERAAMGGGSRSDAAWQAAQWRVESAIQNSHPDWRAAMWLIEPADFDHAIRSEVKKRGEGIATLQVAMKLARLRYEGQSDKVH